MTEPWQYVAYVISVAVMTVCLHSIVRRLVSGKIDRDDVRRRDMAALPPAKDGTLPGQWPPSGPGAERERHARERHADLVAKMAQDRLLVDEQREREHRRPADHRSAPPGKVGAVVVERPKKL